MNKRNRILVGIAAMLLSLLPMTRAVGASPAPDGGYPMNRVNWDNVPAENRQVIEQLFADLRLVPDGNEVKKFYITTREVNTALWQALMGIPVAGEGQSGGSGGGRNARRIVEEDEEDFKDSASVEDTNAFIALLRKQTGKRFRLPTQEERVWAATCQLIDTIADAADFAGKGFHLVLDTIGRSKPMMLVITAKDGTQSNYVLRTKPRVRIEKPYLIVEADGTQISFDLDELQGMRYEIDPTPTGIEQVNADNPAISPRESIRFGNLPDDTTVAVYSIDGKLLSTRQTGDGSLTLPLDDLGSGIYIVKVNGITYKIRKP